MASASLVGEVQKLSNQLGQILKLQRGEKPLASRMGKKDTASFLFEMKALFGMLLRLHTTGWSIQVVRPSNENRMYFVRSPAQKSTGTYFIISKDGLDLHLVHGTQIGDINGEPRAPDISLQLSKGGVNPTYMDVLAIWDAKLRGPNASRSEKPISDSEYARFAKVREWLDPPRPGEASDVLDSWPVAFEVSGLISNGRKNTEPDVVFFNDAVSVAEYYDGPSRQCHPSRLQHISNLKPKRQRAGT